MDAGAALTTTVRMCRGDIGDELTLPGSAGTKNHGGDTGLGVRGSPAPPTLRGSGRGGMTTRPHELRPGGDPEVQRARPLSIFAARRVNPPVYQLGEWALSAGIRLINIAQIRRSRRLPAAGSPTRSATSEVSHPRLRGSFAAGPAAVSGLHSPTWDGWCCERCCATHPDHHGRGRKRIRSRSRIHPEGWRRSGGDAADADGRARACVQVLSSGERPGLQCRRGPSG